MDEMLKSYTEKELRIQKEKEKMLKTAESKLELKNKKIQERVAQAEELMKEKIISLKHKEETAEEKLARKKREYEEERERKKRLEMEKTIVRKQKK